MSPESRQGIVQKSNLDCTMCVSYHCTGSMLDRAAKVGRPDLNGGTPAPAHPPLSERPKADLALG